MPEPIDDSMLTRLRAHLARLAQRPAPAGLEARVIAAVRSRRSRRRRLLVPAALGTATAVAVAVTIAIGLHGPRSGAPSGPAAGMQPTLQRGFGGGAGAERSPMVVAAPVPATVSGGSPAPDGSPTTTFVVVVDTAPGSAGIVLSGPEFVGQPGFDPYAGGVGVCGGRTNPPCLAGHRYQRTFVGLRRPGGQSSGVDYRLTLVPDGRVFSAGSIDPSRSLTYTATYSG